ncbi:MAG TPA: serine/threonine protein kinase, partial [Polyangiales bacterium]|nr:serine/threonine protein kinase [Polyangiales bacterium]
ARTGSLIDSRLERLVLSCLEKDRERRPASAEELRAALSKIELSAPWSRERALGWWSEHLPPNAESSAAH